MKMSIWVLGDAQKDFAVVNGIDLVHPAAKLANRAWYLYRKAIPLSCNNAGAYTQRASPHHKAPNIGSIVVSEYLRPNFGLFSAGFRSYESKSAVSDSALW
jgi:hypothetical protein